MTKQSKSLWHSDPAARELLELFLSCGYVREPSAARRAQDGWQRYKKGFEVRFVLLHPGEIVQAQRLLEQVGLQPGASFRTHSRYVLPVYGKPAFDWFAQNLPRGSAGSEAGLAASAARKVRRGWGSSGPRRPKPAPWAGKFR